MFNFVSYFNVLFGRDTTVTYLCYQHFSYLINIIYIYLADNLTPFGTASQSSRYIRSTPDGAILPPISNRFTLETCSTTNVDGAPKAWWMFQFSFLSAFITDITIYYREGCKYETFFIHNQCMQDCSQ